MRCGLAGDDSGVCVCVCLSLSQAHCCGGGGTPSPPYGQPLLGHAGHHHRSQPHAAGGATDAADAG